jgi:tRNA(Ile)-lysidine synthase
MLEHIRLNLLHVCGLKEDDLVVVAVSGGPDSLCLLDALHRMGQPLAAAHFDHGLRADAAEDARAVQAEAERRGVAFVTRQVDVAAYARAEKLSLEEAARAARYAFLFESAARLGAAAVATGHTADDQAETVLMHLLRGAGLSGLRGMAYRSLPNPWSETIALVRPLLGTWRKEIEGYIRERNLRPLTDSTNAETRFYRNRLRLETLPYLDGLVPGVRQRLVRMAALLEDEDALLSEMAQDAFAACLPLRAPGRLSLEAGQLRRQPAALQRRVLRMAIAALRPGLRDIDAAAVEAARAFVAAPTRTGQRDLTANLMLRMEGERLAVIDTLLPEEPPPDLPQIAGRVALPIPGQVRLPGGWRVSVERLPATPELVRQAQGNSDRWTAYLDPAGLPGELSLQPPQAGQRFAPLGLGGATQKLSDAFINHKIPREARKGWPVLMAGAEAAWLAGVRISEKVKVRQGTVEMIKIRLAQSMLDRP